MRDEKYVIWSWEHRAWWKPNHEGYTDLLQDAGHYTFDEAANITVGHVPAGEEIAMFLVEAQQRGHPEVYGVVDA